MTIILNIFDLHGLRSPLLRWKIILYHNAFGAPPGVFWLFLSWRATNLFRPFQQCKPYHGSYWGSLSSQNLHFAIRLIWFCSAALLCKDFKRLNHLCVRILSISAVTPFMFGHAAIALHRLCTLLLAVFRFIASSVAIRAAKNDFHIRNSA